MAKIRVKQSVYRKWGRGYRYDDLGMLELSRVPIRGESVTIDGKTLRVYNVSHLTNEVDAEVLTETW